MTATEEKQQERAAAKLSRKISELEAKAAAYQHAGESMERPWTVDELEKKASEKLANQFHGNADKNRAKASELERNGEPEKVAKGDPGAGGEGHDTPGAGDSPQSRMSAMAKKLAAARELLERILAVNELSDELATEAEAVVDMLGDDA